MMTEELRKKCDDAARVLAMLDIPESKDPFLHRPGAEQEAPSVNWVQLYGRALAQEHEVRVAEVVEGIEKAFVRKYGAPIDGWTERFDRHDSDAGAVAQIHPGIVWLDHDCEEFELIKQGKSLAVVDGAAAYGTCDLLIRPNRRWQNFPYSYVQVMKIAEQERGITGVVRVISPADLLKQKVDFLEYGAKRYRDERRGLSNGQYDRATSATRQLIGCREQNRRAEGRPRKGRGR